VDLSAEEKWMKAVARIDGRTAEHTLTFGLTAKARPRRIL